MCSTDDSKRVLRGGKHIHQELLEKGLVESGHSVRIAYLNEIPRPFLQRLRSKISRMLGLITQADQYVHLLQFQSKVLEQQVISSLQDESVDLISSQDPLSTYAIQNALKKLGLQIPIATTLHGYYTLETLNYGYFEGEKNRKILSDYTLAVENQSAASSSHLFCVDSQIVDYAQSLGSPAQIHLLHNAIDNQRFVPLNEADKAKLQAKLGFAQEKMILVARRFVLKNGLHQALDALHLLKQMPGCPPIKLAIVGEGPEEANLKKQSSELGLEQQIHWQGLVPHAQVHEWYQAADLVLMPSTRSDGVEEATSLSMLEGMSCGNPVLATAIGGMKEVIRHGENGFLVEDKNPQAMAEQMFQILCQSEQSAKIGENAHHFVRAHHGYLTHAQTWLEKAKS